MHSNGDHSAVNLRGSQSHKVVTKPRSLASHEDTVKPRNSADHDETTKRKRLLSQDSDLKPGGGKNPKIIRNLSLNNQIPHTKYPQADSTITRKSTSPASLASLVKLQSQLKITRYSTFKDTPLGYKPAPQVHNPRDTCDGNDRDSCQGIRDTTIKFNDPISQARGEHSLQQAENSSSVEQLDITVDDGQTQGSVVSHSPAHSPSLDNHLYQQAQRYDKLNQVLALLQQVKGGQMDNEQSSPGTPVKMSEFKTHIKTALDEAVRLRADTEALQQRVVMATVSWNVL